MSETMKPCPTEMATPHQWTKNPELPWYVCALCGCVRRIDNGNGPCPGNVKVTLRTHPIPAPVRAWIEMRDTYHDPEAEVEEGTIAAVERDLYQWATAEWPEEG